MNIPYVKDTLPNGLDVIIHEDHRCPIVAVNVWYHVGSKNERAGRTGFAHLFEHLMFEGSQHYDRGYFHPLQKAGAALNGSTNVDRTNYWEVAPTGALELALWMESDRMGWLLPALTSAKFETQREVVLNERRQHYENRPYGRAMMAVVAALYPPDHPYHWLTIGAADDLRAATCEDAREFFRAHYHPGNASLALAGDVDAARGLVLARRYFGDIERGPDPPHLRIGPDRSTSAEDVRLLLEDQVELPRLYVAWCTPRLFGEGDAELDLLADVLGNGKTSRLYRTLVYDRRLASDVAVAQNSRELSSVFHIIVTAAPGHGLDVIEEAITTEIARLAADGPTGEELERALAQAEAQFVYRVQTVGGFGGKSDQLNAYNIFIGDPGFFARDLARYRAVTIETVRGVAAQPLVRERRVALSVVPCGRRALAVRGSEPVLVS